MTRQTRVRLFSVLVLLAALAGVLATPTAQQAASAAPCCSSCDYQFESCLAGTYYPSCGGDPGCCDAAVSSCWRWCSFSC
jgi:hypothetical protein